MRCNVRFESETGEGRDVSRSVSIVVHDDIEFILQRLHNYFQDFLNFFLLRVQDAEILCREIF